MKKSEISHAENMSVRFSLIADIGLASSALCQKRTYKFFKSKFVGCFETLRANLQEVHDGKDAR